MNTLFRPATDSPVVLVTGAAGGLGQGLVTAFAAAGWQVAAGWHRTPLNADSPRVWPVPLDVTQRGEIEAAVSEIRSRWKRLDVLVNNAGITADRPLWQQDEALWDRVLEVNLKGALLCAQAVLPVMLEQQDGHILNVSSYSGRVGARGQTNYAAAKAGLIALTQSLAREVGAANVRVNTVLPGVLPTRMTRHLTPDQLADFAAGNVLGRLNAIDEVARFMVFLATLRNVSGQCFQLDSRIARW